MNHKGIRKELIISRLVEIIKKFQTIRPCVPDEELRNRYNKQDIAGMVAFIKKNLALPLRVKLALVNSGGPANAIAFIFYPEELPLYGTSAFQDSEARLHIRKNFIAQAKFESVVFAITHELCHVLIAALKMQFESEAEEEVVVDLTTMVMGYRKFFLMGCKHSTHSGFQKKLEYKNLGYLNEEEINFAHDLIEFHIKITQS